MQRNLYFENYINNIQKNIFLLAFDLNYNIVEFISCYMKSNVRHEIDKPYSSWHNQPERRIFEEVLNENKVHIVKRQTINRDAVEWLGYFYSRWHFITGESSKIILRFLPAQLGLKQFFTLHQLDEVEAINICKRHYNLSRNKHRKYECKNLDKDIINYDDPVYYSFLAVRMLYKLRKDNVFSSLKYVGDESVFDFISDEFSVCVKGDVIFSKNNTSIINKYEQVEHSMNNYLRKGNQNIYFCFVFSKQYEIDDEKHEKLLIDLNKLKEKFSPNNRHFEYIYFYMVGNLYEITPTNELYVYSMPFSQKERIGVLNEMKKYFLL